MLLIVSENPRYIYEIFDAGYTICKSTIPLQLDCLDIFETKIIWEACDSDLFHLYCLYENDKFRIISKFLTIMNAIENCCMLEDLQIVTNQENYSLLQQEISQYKSSIRISIKQIEENIQGDITTIKNKGCLIVSKNIDNVLEYASYIQVPYVAVSLKYQYSTSELQQIYQKVISMNKQIIAVTCITKINVFDDPSGFKNDFIRAINISRLLGVQYVIYGSSTTKTVKTYSKPVLTKSLQQSMYLIFIKMMKSICSYAKNYNIKIILKPNRLAEFLKYVDNIITDIDSPNIIKCPVRDYKYCDNIYDDFTIYEFKDLASLNIVQSKLEM